MTSKERPRLQQQHAKKKKPQRVRVTNKALESRQFSTVRLPRTSEVSSQKADVNSMYQELEGGRNHPSVADAATGKPSRTASAAPSPSPSAFDPIIQDPMFTVVASSNFWPPPSLEELHAKTGHDHGDGFDSYDRREDDKLARKERTKVIKGEINHPRGKPRKNTIVRLSDSASDNDDVQVSHVLKYMGRLLHVSGRLYRFLASDARRLALLFEAASTELHQASESFIASVKNAAGSSESSTVSLDGCLSCEEVTLTEPTAAARQAHQCPISAGEQTKDDAFPTTVGSFARAKAGAAFCSTPEIDWATSSASSAEGLSAIAASAVRRLCRSVEGEDLTMGVVDSANCLPLRSLTTQPASASVDWLHAWLACMATTVSVTGNAFCLASAPLVSPVQAHHSLTTKTTVAPDTAPPPLSRPHNLSEAERAVANAVASRLGLPSRFHWPSSSRSASLTGNASNGSAGGRNNHHDPSQATLMLWPTAMRTTSGDIASRPSVSTRCPLLTSSLTALPTVATAKQVFAKAPAPSPTSSRIPAEGGGVLCSTSLEACTVLLHTARTQAMTRATGLHNAFAGNASARHWSHRLVLYCGDQCDVLLLRAAQLMGITEIRVIQTTAVELKCSLSAAHSSDTDTVVGDSCSLYNYAMDVLQLQSRLVEDVSAGFYPLMVVGTFGSRLSGAIDPLLAISRFCQRLGVWFHIDASSGGTALLAEHIDRTQQQQQRRGAIITEFHKAASLADSVMVPTGLSTALPYAAIPVSPASCFSSTSCTALFFAHVRKVAWSLQALGEARQCTFNQWITPGVEESDVLHLSPLSHMAGWLLEQHAIHTLTTTDVRAEGLHAAGQFMPVASLALAKRVDAHQDFVRAVLQTIRGDGRFDASLDGSMFGIVCLRWLTGADEATVELARAWSKVLIQSRHMPASFKHEGAASTTAHPSNASSSSTACRLASIDARMDEQGEPPVQVFVGLVQLQRRVWVHVSFGVLLDPAKDGLAGFVSHGEDTTTREELVGDPVKFASRRALAYVQRTLDEAASLVQTAHAVERISGE